MAVPPSLREEPTGPEDVCQNAPEADSTEAAVVVDLMETAEPEEQEAEAEPEPRRAPLLVFWRRRDRGGPADRYSPDW